MLFHGEPLRPDLGGWRRERLEVLPDEALIDVVPDWVCEILSPSNPTNDTIRKKRIYQRAGVGHWILDPRDESLQVFRCQPGGYLEVLGAQRGDVVRAEPLDAIEIAVGVFFGDGDPR